jgi:protoporphyrinogen oxidase
MQVGGMSRTVRTDDGAFDLGGHILFVRDVAREAWLRELLGNDLRWVDRPVCSVQDGAVVPGRYLDRRKVGVGPPPSAAVLDDAESAEHLLVRAFGGEVVDRWMRRYLEKVDGMPLHAITASRARKLLVEQYAPEGFWFAAHGVGQLMDAMGRAILAGGGEILCGTSVESIRVEGGRTVSIAVYGRDGRPLTVTAGSVVAGMPALRVAGLINGEVPPLPQPPPPFRAAIIVALVLETPRLTSHPWIQIDRSDVPFARLAEMKNWSPVLCPPDHSVVVCEVYCDPAPDDRWWGLEDAVVGRACASALIAPLGWLDAGVAVRTLQVVRIPKAWPLVSVAAEASVASTASAIAGIDGLVVAQGGDVVSAIEAGERAAMAVLGGRRDVPASG